MLITLPLTTRIALSANLAATTMSMILRDRMSYSTVSKENVTHAWIFVDIMADFSFSSKKWELLSITDIVMDQISTFDETLQSERVKKEE